MSSRLWKIYTMWKFLFFSGSTYPNGVGYWETGFLYLKTSGDPGSQLPPTKDVPSDDFWDNRLTCLLGILHPGTTHGFTAPYRLTVQSSLDSPPRACESTWSGKGIIYLFSLGQSHHSKGRTLFLNTDTSNSPGLPLPVDFLHHDRYLATLYLR